MYGDIDGVNLYGRKTGNGGWAFLGRFNATPGNVAVPLADGAPEQWEFYNRAVKRDVEIGNPSPVMTAITLVSFRLYAWGAPVGWDRRAFRFWAALFVARKARSQARR